MSLSLGDRKKCVVSLVSAHIKRLCFHKTKLKKNKRVQELSPRFPSIADNLCAEPASSIQVNDSYDMQRQRRKEGRHLLECGELPIFSCEKRYSPGTKKAPSFV